MSPGIFPVAAETEWVLDSSGPERLPKTVYVRFDGASETFTDDIILDETAPTVSSATLSGNPTRSVSAAVPSEAKRYRLRLKAKDNAAGVSRYQLGGKKRKTTSRPKSIGKANRTVAKTLVVNSSFVPRRIRVQDAAGNWSRWRIIKKRTK